MYENRQHIHINDKILSRLTLGCKNISEFSVVSEGFDSSARDLKALIEKKAAVTLVDGLSSKIILTANGAVDGLITARFEDGNLIIRAKDEAAMKKAVFCFWFDNIGHRISEYDLPCALDYSVDLSKTVFYSDFGVSQTPGVCCIDELIAAHNYANERGFKVYADLGAKYYVSSIEKNVNIRTDVEWGNAEFTLDDSHIPTEKGKDWLFIIQPSADEYSVTPPENLTIDRNSQNIGFAPPQKSIVTFFDETKTQYIRHGSNANSGSTKRDSVVIDTDGSIDTDAPFMWDFDNVSSISIRPIDAKVITISGGIFTTIANCHPCDLVSASYTYYARGILVLRSNTNIKNITHYIVGEGEKGCPYSGFFFIHNCAYVTVEDCLLSGHKTYRNAVVPLGTYDIGGINVISMIFKNCYQVNDITAEKLWGIMGMNYIKNIVYDSCVLSRFDAHAGVTNAKIIDSVIGRSGVSVVGYGKLILENSKFYSKQMINLRNDYGSTWDGDVIIKNCEFIPSIEGEQVLIRAQNHEKHNFGYPCYAPKNIKIDGLRVCSSERVYIMSDPNPNHNTEDFEAEYPYYPSETITLKNYTSDSGEAPILCPNKIIFRNIEFSIQ